MKKTYSSSAKRNIFAKIIFALLLCGWSSVSMGRSFVSPISVSSGDTLCADTVYRSLTVCDSLLWIVQPGFPEDATPDTVGVFTASDSALTHTTLSSEGCDSVIIMNLIVNHSAFVDTTISACGSLVWNDSTYTASTDVTHNFTTADGCDSVYTMHLTVLTPPRVHFTDRFSCSSMDYILSTVCSPDTRYTYTWTSNPHDPTMAGQEHNEFLNVTPRQATNYSVTVDYADAESCPTTHDTTLVKVAKPTAQMHITPEFLTYEYHTFTAIDQSFDHLTRKWYVNGSLYTENPSFTYEVPLTEDSVHVMLHVSTETCQDSVAQVIPIKKSIFYIPNIFTPGEISNNIFKVSGHGILDYHIYIYNRRGALVFESQDIEEGWDGTFNGQTCPMSAYPYIIKYTTVDIPRGEQILTGTITLLR